MRINITITQDDILKNPDIITGIREFAMHLKDVSESHKEEKKNSFELGEVKNKTECNEKQSNSNEPEKVQMQEASQHTVDDIRAIAVNVAKTKGSKAVRNILNSFGFNKVSDITEDKFDTVYKLLEEEL